MRGAPKARVYACADALKARVESSGARVKRARLACVKRCEALLERFQRRFEACLKRCEARLKRFRFEASLKRCEARLTCCEALRDTLLGAARLVERRAFASGPTSDHSGFFSETLQLKELSGNLAEELYEVLASPCARIPLSSLPKSSTK